MLSAPCRRGGLAAAACLSLALSAAPAHAQWLQNLQRYLRPVPAGWPTSPAQVYTGPADQVAQMPVPAFPRVDGFRVLDDLRQAWNTQGTPAHSFQNFMQGIPGGGAAMDRFEGTFLTPGMNGPRPATVYSGLQQQAKNPWLPIRNDVYWNARNANEQNGWTVAPQAPFAPPGGLRNMKDRIAISSGIANEVQQDLRNQAVGTVMGMGHDLYQGTIDYAGQRMADFATGSFFGGGSPDAGNQGMPAQDSTGGGMP